MRSKELFAEKQKFKRDQSQEELGELMSQADPGPQNSCPSLNCNTLNVAAFGDVAFD